MFKTAGEENIKISDQVKFVLDTKDGEGCLRTPYKITNATIYFVNREFTDPAATEYQKETVDASLNEQYETLKRYICSKAKKNVRASTNQEITLFGEQTIDGIGVKEGDRVLVKDQSDKETNGIYVVMSSSWSRSEDANSTEKVTNGMYVFVDEGIDNISTGWVLDSANVILSSSSLDFLRFSSPSDPVAAPTEKSLESLRLLKARLDGSKMSSQFFYKEAVAVKVFGGYTDPETNEMFPAWLNPQMVPYELKTKTERDNILVPYESGNEVVEGKFVLEWDTNGCREGDYFICWSWMPNLAGDVVSAHMFFSLDGSTLVTTSIPTHFTNPNKYETLLERYTPDMFKTVISDADLTPKVMRGLNGAVAAGFTSLEDMANQIIDLLDSNATHEQLLPLLANMFNLNLKSSDPTLWRRQIKKAIPNFKKKGSVVGLKEAFSDAGMKFLKITKLWQIVSKYTFQEHFDYSGSNVFDLSKNIVLDLGITAEGDSDFGLWLRKAGSEWEDLKPEVAPAGWSDLYVTFSNGQMTWVGGELKEGDSIRVLYKTRQIPSGERNIEEYIRQLPLMDDRDERNQAYPLKNWNTRLIEEDDDLFDLLVPVRHPLADPIIWGRIRTEFPYSENAYNMEEYNGSKRDSMDPCDIDKEFVDPCGQCQSSKYSLDLEVESLSDESLQEAKRVSEEFMPMHAVIHSFNFSGSVSEFIKPNEEKIEALVTYAAEDVILAGEGQHVFNRDMDKREMQNIKRNALADMTIAITNASGIMRNKRVVLQPSGISTEDDLNDPLFKNKTQVFEAININTEYPDLDPFESENLLEVLGKTVKNYTISNFSRNSAEIYGTVDDMSVGPLFEYRISNKITDLNVDITQSNRITFSDENADFWMLGITTQHDVDEGLSDSAVWAFKHQDKEYAVQNIMPDGSLLLSEETSIIPISGWELSDGNKIVKSSISGTKNTASYGFVEINYPVVDVRKVLKIGDYVYIGSPNATRRYKIKSFNTGSENGFYIEDYSDGSVGGENIKVYRRVMENKVGQFGYEGIVLDAESDIEKDLSISNGVNKNPDNIRSDNVRENFLVLFDQKYYSIAEIDGSTLILNGPMESFTLDGQNATFSIYKFSKRGLSVAERQIPSVPGNVFEFVDRSGKGTIKVSQDNALAGTLTMLNSANSGETVDMVGQNENIEFQIEYREEI